MVDFLLMLTNRSMTSRRVPDASARSAGRAGSLGHEERRSDRAMGPSAAQVPREQCFGPKSDEISHLKSYRTSKRSSGGSANAPKALL